MAELKTLLFGVFHIKNRIEKGIVSGLGRPESILKKERYYSFVDGHRPIMGLGRLVVSQLKADFDGEVTA